MKILVTGAEGFIGKNLMAELKNRGYNNILSYDRETDASLLETYCKEADFVFHLAGVNRPEDPAEFMEGNFGFTSKLLELLKRLNNSCPIMISSSIQAELNNLYGKSKKAGEDLMFEYGRETGSKVLVYRFPNAFGKWCKPNYNSVIATFCHNISRDLPVQVNNPSTMMKLVYIDDIIEELMNALEGKETKKGKFCEVSTVHEIALGDIVDLIYSFRKSRMDKSVPNMSDIFIKKLYSTYLSYIPENDFGYDLDMNVDYRGVFTEIIRTPDRGQISVNISKPGITRGNHWHHSKNEKFLVVSGNGVIRFRRIDSDEVLEYFVSGDKMKILDIPTGYTHNIENLGNTDLVTIMWANEPFDPERPDTYYLEV